MPLWTQESGLTQCPSSGKTPMGFGSRSIPKCNKSFPAYGRLQWTRASVHPNTWQSPMDLGIRSILAHKPLYTQEQDYHNAMSAPADTDFQLFFIKKQVLFLLRHQTYTPAHLLEAGQTIRGLRTPMAHRFMDHISCPAQDLQMGWLVVGFPRQSSQTGVISFFFKYTDSKIMA